MDKLSYALGVGIGRQLVALGHSELQIEDFAQAVRDIVEGKKTAMDDQEARRIVNQFLSEAEEKRTAAQKKAGEDFLKENAKRPGVHTTKSGLQYEILKEGTGR